MSRSGCVLALLWCETAIAQTPISSPVNGFTPADEVELGQAAADAVRDRLTPLKDAAVARFVADIGRRLSASIPTDLRQTAFHYEVEVLNVRDVTSFAFPGGPIFISARLIELADNE